VRRSLGPLIGVALLIGVVASVTYAFEYLTVDQYLAFTDDADVNTNDVAIVSKMSGVVREILVTDHQEVVAGQVLARLKSQDDTAAEAPSIVDIIAPAAGIVTTIDLHIGKAVTGQRPLMSLIRMEKTDIIARFRESDMTYVAVGQAVTIEAGALGDVRFYGYVASIVPVGEDRARQQNVNRIAVRIVLRESKPVELRSGMPVRATIYTGLIDNELLSATIPSRNGANACRAKSMLFDLDPRAIHVSQSI
jgi:multidrug resistance efflux pump